MKLAPLAVIACGLAILGWLAAAGIGARGDALARYQRALVEARSPQPRSAGGVAIVALDRAEAQRRFESLIADRASQVGLRLAIAPEPAAGDKILVARISAPGGEEAIRAFVRSIENGRPTVRLARWSVRQQGAALALEGQALGLWQPAATANARGDVPIVVLIQEPSARTSGALFATDVGVRPVPSASGPPELIGIVGRLAVDPRAIVRLADGSTRILAPGEKIGVWRLTSVGADRVRLARGGNERTLVLPSTVELPAPDQ